MLDHTFNAIHVVDEKINLTASVNNLVKRFSVGA